MQSLPSFAQAFSRSSLSDSPVSNALPPIQSHKKRARPNSPRRSNTPLVVRVKEESPPSRDPSATPPSKKHRLTGSPTPAPSPVVPVFDDRRPSLSAARSPPPDQRMLPRIGRVSPPSGSRPLTPPPSDAPKPPQPAAAHSLPPPPISFARRRAAQPGARKKKPADILISPRGTGPSDPLAPVIQSAPPVADPGRFPMAIPRLPLVLNNAPATRRVAGNVPPTPTRFSLQGTAAPLVSAATRTMQSPPNRSVPIANALVPPTPHALHHPGCTGDKSAFLAPFEVFYEALNDSKQLKGWLSDQLQKSNALMASLKQQQDKMDEVVEDLVEKRTRVMREEITMLRQRMESLEEALLAVRAEASTRGGYPQGAKLHPNGLPPGAEPPSSYRFPERKPDTTTGREPSSSPPVEVARRLSVSAVPARPDPPLHSCFALGGHCRGASGSQGGAKIAPPVRPPGIAERSPARPADSRPAPRLYYPSSYGNSNPPLVEGQTPRVGDKS